MLASRLGFRRWQPTSTSLQHQWKPFDNTSSITLHIPFPRARRPQWHLHRQAHTARPRRRNPQPDPPSSSFFERISSLVERISQRTRPILRPLLFFLYTLLVYRLVADYSPVVVRKINGASMAPTLSPEIASNPASGRKDSVLFLRMGYGKLETLDDSETKVNEEENGQAHKKEARFRRSLRRGMIVCFASPRDPNKLVVKRVVGLPGDAITPLVRQTKLIRGDQEKRIEPGACPRLDSRQQQSGEPTAVTVPFGHVWIEGENPSQSVDSNDYGPISQSLIVEFAYAPVHAMLSGRVKWEDDGWEKRMGLTGEGSKKGRLRKRESLEDWKGEAALGEGWKLYGPAAV